MSNKQAQALIHQDLLDKVTVNFRFKDIEEPTYETLHDKIDYFLRTKASSYLKSELKHDDAEMHIDAVMLKNKQWLFEWHVDFDIKNWRDLIRYETSKPFKNLEDIISHAFQHLKERLAGEKKK